MENCVYCKSNKIVRAGKNKNNVQRYVCRNCDRCFNELTNPNIGVVLNGEKYCSKCEKFKPVLDFQIKDNKLRYCCKKCASKLSKARYRNHNITELEFNNMLQLQKNKCSICNNDFKSNRHAYIDHNHENNKNRGVLCPKCNILLGACKDNINILKNAINYLLMHK